MTGRKPSQVWENFKKIIVSGRKGCRAKCHHCEVILEGQVARLQNHMKKCSSRSESVDLDQDEPENEQLDSGQLVKIITNL